MTERVLRHAVVGCGRVAPCHGDAFQRLAGVRLRAACDVDRGAAEAFARRFGAERVVSSYDEVLDDPEVDSISLAVPHDLHAPMALQAIERGKHVLIEKPVVIEVADGAALIGRAEARGVVAMPVAQHRFDAVTRYARELIDGGALGELTMVQGRLDCARPPEYYRDSPWRGSWAREGGSVLINQAYHVVDLMRHLGGPVASVQARMDCLAGREVMETEDVVSAVIRFGNGALGTLAVNGAGTSQWYSLVEVVGTAGHLAFDIGQTNIVHRFHLSSRRTMRDYKQKFKAALEAGVVPMTGAAGYYGVSHRDQAAAFVDRILGREGASGADLVQAVGVVALIQSIYRSARSGAAVEVADEPPRRAASAPIARTG